MWRGGCIIRSKFLGNIKEAFDKNENLENLLFDPYFVNKMQATHVSAIFKRYNNNDQVSNEVLFYSLAGDALLPSPLLAVSPFPPSLPLWLTLTV